MPIARARQYIIQQVITPSTLTANTVYLTIRNTVVLPAAEPVMALKAVVPQALFTGTIGTAGSLFGVQRVTATPTGGATLTPFKSNSGAPNADVEVRFANAGLANVTPNGSAIWHFGSPAQSVATTPPLMVWDDENPVLLLPGECLIIYAHNAIVAATNVSLHLRWFQVVNG